MPVKIAIRLILLGMLIGLIGVFLMDVNTTIGTIIAFTGIAIKLYGIFRLAWP